MRQATGLDSLQNKKLNDMKHNSLKRIMLTLAVMLAFALPAAAQHGLNIDNVFSKYGDA